MNFVLRLCKKLHLLYWQSDNNMSADVEAVGILKVHSFHN